MEIEPLTETEIDNVRQGLGGMPSSVIIQRLLATLDYSVEIATYEGYEEGYSEGWGKGYEDGAFDVRTTVT